MIKAVKTIGIATVCESVLIFPYSGNHIARF